MERSVIAVAVVVAAIAAAVLWESASGTDEASPTDRPVHVHGLGVDPADGALLIATHTGLWRLNPGEDEGARVGDSRQDTMGFTVVGPNRFLGSGHPDLRDDLPPHLGLIESTDAGMTWRSVSLLGEADFHVLRFVNGRLYGFDSSTGRLLVSDDMGRSWAERVAPGLVLDLAVHPRNTERLVATTSRGLTRSDDGGRTWTTIGQALGYLAWPTDNRLYLIDMRGAVYVSADSGAGLESFGSLSSEPAALLAVTDAELYVALHDGAIRQSIDGGVTWTTRTSG